MLPQFPENPFQIQLSFHKVIERLEDMAANDALHGANAQLLLQKVAAHPELRDGITNIRQLEDNALLIADLLADLFPAALSNNEIKAVSIPYQGLIFNYSERFKKIIADAGPSFEINIRDFDDHQFYILSCCIILNRFYGTQLDFAKPLFYDIPTAEGYMKHYRILYNADFLEIIPTADAPKLTRQDIDLLINSYDNLDLWKQKFPKNAWVLKGFSIMNLFDATVENAVSALKTNLLGNAAAADLQHNLLSIFQSIFRIPDLKMGFTSFDREEGKFNNAPLGQKLSSYLLPYQHEEECEKVLCGCAYQSIIQDHVYFAVSDVEAFIKNEPGSQLGKHMLAQNIQSFILAPVVKNNMLLGVLELVSTHKRELNSVTANKLDTVMPFLVDTIDRKINELQNRIQAIIQNNYTTLHPSVYWKFKREAQKYIQSINSGSAYMLKEIVFGDVYPLYGQVDIKDSSITRNLSVKSDLLNQLNHLISLFEQLNQHQLIIAAEKHLLELKAFVDDLAIDVRADTEQHIQHYLETNIYPLLRSADQHDISLAEAIGKYFKDINSLTGDFHLNRRNYERTLFLVNEQLIHILDKRQAEIQAYLPHYYERFKTDGVEHSMYIGASIAQGRQFEIADLHRLRLWELMVITEMEIVQHQLKPTLPYHLGVKSLVLVFGTPIAIRFRMDEKHFDIDGAYNIRYEMIKKRIDKAHIKNTGERITKEGKIAIIYTAAEEEAEYLQYISILQLKGFLDSHIEHFEVEDLQGVSGLKAIRVGVVYDKVIEDGFSYDGLYNQLEPLP